MIKRLLILALTTAILSACSSGKRLLENGQYDEAVITAANRLRQDPDNNKAKHTLKAAYAYAKDFHLKNISNGMASQDIYKWESVVNDYTQLNMLSDEIRRCPACLSITPNPYYASTDLNQAKNKAAETRYALGEKSMQANTRNEARQAYEHFLACKRFVPNFKDVSEKIKEAKYQATLKVLVEPIPMHSNLLKLSNDFFENKIHESLTRMADNEFVRFYTQPEAESMGLKEPDHVIRLTFDDFIIGQTSVKETVVPCKKDSVEVAKDRDGKPIYGTVTAEFHQFKKVVASTGLLDFKVMDKKTKATITNEKFPGTFNWFCEWGYYNGDSRALSTAQLDLSKNKEMMPPPPQDLFIEFCKPIHEQVGNKIRAFYRNF